MKFFVCNRLLSARQFLKRASNAGLLMGALVVPLKEKGAWTQVPFSSGEANQRRHSSEGMSIAVKASAGPIVYKLSQVQELKEIEVQGSLSKLIDFKEGQKQGEKNADDFALRIGFIVPGDRKLNWLQRQAAADWVLTLFKLAPKGQGLKHIFFLNGVQQKELLGKEREHPASDLIREKFVWLLDKTGDFSFKHKFTQPIKTGALWIGVDGDDTESEFTLRLKQLHLQ